MDWVSSFGLWVWGEGGWVMREAHMHSKFGMRRPREMDPICMRVTWGWVKRVPINFGETRPRESKPMSTFVWVQKAKGNGSYMYLLMPWGRAKRAPINFRETRPRESKPRSKFVWVHKAKWNKSYIYIYIYIYITVVLYFRRRQLFYISCSWRIKIYLATPSVNWNQICIL